MPIVADAIAIRPAAKPSSPSVRFTAFDDPDTTTPVNTMNTGTEKTAATSAKNGTAVHVVGCPEIGFQIR